MVQMYQKTPSELMKINDEYIGYCLNEAIAEFIMHIEKGEKPRFKIKEEKVKNRSKGDNPGLNMLTGNNIYT